MRRGRGTLNGQLDGYVNGGVNGYVNGEINGEINVEINALSSALRDVYLIVRSNPGIKIKQVADARGRSESTVGKQLVELSEKGMIEYRGDKRTGGYYPK